MRCSEYQLEREQDQMMQTWCSWCKAVRAMTDIHSLEEKGSGKQALEGRCSVCGESMFTIGTLEDSDYTVPEVRKALIS